MRAPCLHLVLVFLLATSSTAAAVAGEYRDPAGFSFTYPEGWLAVSEPSKTLVNNAPPEIRSWLDKNRVSLSQVTMVLVRVAPEEFVESLNVVVTPQEIPIKQETIAKLLTTLTQQYGSLGATIKNLNARLQNVDANEVIVVDFDSRLPGVAFPMHQRQVFFPGGGKTYIVTCTAKPETFPKYEPTFDTILASFTVPAPTAQGFDLKRIWGGARNGAIFGAVAGALAAAGVALFKKLSSRARPASQDDAPSAPREP
jgi:hypothetical protein